VSGEGRVDFDKALTPDEFDELMQLNDGILWADEAGFWLDEAEFGRIKQAFTSVIDFLAGIGRSCTGVLECKDEEGIDHFKVEFRHNEFRVLKGSIAYEAWEDVAGKAPPKKKKKLQPVTEQELKEQIAADLAKM